MKKLFLLITIASLSCEQGASKKGAQKEGLVKSYSKSGKLLSEINYKDGKREGIGKSYYKTGSVQFEIPYVEGRREGVLRKFYENGKVYQETEFVSDKQTGFQRTYRENGKLRSEASYEDGEPCVGLKEYLLNGDVKKNYPTIVSKVEDRVKERGEYTVYLSLSKKSGRVEFYRGNLSKSECLNNRLIPIPFNKQLGEGELKYRLPVGSFIMEEVNIVARVFTLAGNSFLTQKKIRIAIDN